MLPLHLQFRKLISDPLSIIEVRPRLAVIVIDALDERGTAATRESTNQSQQAFFALSYYRHEPCKHRHLQCVRISAHTNSTSHLQLTLTISWHIFAVSIRNLFSKPELFYLTHIHDYRAKPLGSLPPWPTSLPRIYCIRPRSSTYLTAG
jgi:hypothetical protein